MASHAVGFANHTRALPMLDCVPGNHMKPVETRTTRDKRDSVSDCRTHNDERTDSSDTDIRTSRHADYRTGKVIRKRIEEHSGFETTVR